MSDWKVHAYLLSIELWETPTSVYRLVEKHFLENENGKKSEAKTSESHCGRWL